MKAVLFDLDGTLIDSAQDIALALRLTLEELGLSHREPKDVKALIGGGIKALLEKVLGEDFRKEHVKVFRKHYIANPVVHTKLYDGMFETLQRLSYEGKRLAVVTNKMEELSLEILRKLEVIDFFDVVVGGDTFSEKKPSPMPVIETLNRIGVEPSEALMVGDTHADIEAGKRAGVKTALALWGYVRVNSLKPDYELRSPPDILSLTSPVSGA